MKYGDHAQRSCQLRTGTRVGIPQQIQNHSKRDDKYGRKLISNGVFREIRGSVKKDTCPVVKAAATPGSSDVLGGIRTQRLEHKEPCMTGRVVRQLSEDPIAEF